MEVNVGGFEDNGEIIQLLLEPNDSILAIQQTINDLYPDQIPINDLHVTLCESGRSILGIAIPWSIRVIDEVYRVSREDKTSFFMKLSKKDSEILKPYTESTDRVLHISITNLTGEPRSSIARVWEYNMEQIL
jgi:hypothetical protein